jgi:hypothetical protein
LHRCSTSGMSPFSLALKSPRVWVRTKQRSPLGLPLYMGETVTRANVVMVTAIPRMGAATAAPVEVAPNVRARSLALSLISLPILVAVGVPPGPQSRQRCRTTLIPIKSKLPQLFVCGRVEGSGHFLFPGACRGIKARATGRALLR